MTIVYEETDIAVIGMNGRFPGASNLEEYWHNVRDGVESIQHFNTDELLSQGIAPSLLDDSNYVRAAAFLEAPLAFDAPFFDMSHREAEITDPQHRVLLESAWAALEHAGYNPKTYKGAIGVYAGATINTYLLLNLSTNPQIIEELEQVQLNIGNSGDFLTTRIAYKLNLKGACYTVQSACSTSLVAVHLACENLLSEACDMALAGGVSINMGFRHGYRYLEGGMTSPDGRCRPFDAQAKGTIFGSGVGLIVLKRLENALEDGDTIHAIIKGSAINNDGSLKVGYTAPSVDGQAQVITEAMATAGIDARSISYIEAHGTATPLGDPIEIQALTKSFRADTEATGFCAIGSVKSNIGHLDAAAGSAGLIKTILALKAKQLPPSLHYNRPNPNIDFARTPFYVNATLADWHTDNLPRRAGVSAFGVGGTNAHVIVEEAPKASVVEPSRPWQLILVSAKTETAVTRMMTNLATHLTNYPEQSLADVAYTLQVGREAFAHRRLVVAQTTAETAGKLTTPEHILASHYQDQGKRPSLLFMCTGQGAQHINMGRDLSEQEPVFRDEVEHCALYLKSELGFDLRTILYPEPDQEATARQQLTQTAVAQPALFVIEYALAQLLRSWGLEPTHLVGHSLGEYVAACLAGVFTLQDGLKIVATRGRLMQSLPKGAMLAVPLPEFGLEAYLNDEVAIAAVNGPSRCVLSGTPAAIAHLAQQFEREGIAARHLHTSHAFHSPMMAPILTEFTTFMQQMLLHPPNKPYLSNLNGTWITDQEATDPSYWANHLRHTIRFADNLTHLLAKDKAVLIELGPGQMLSRLTRQHPDYRNGRPVIPFLRHPNDSKNDLAVALDALGRLWLAGIEPDWSQFYGYEQRQRVPLPTYAFDRQQYVVEPAQSQTAMTPSTTKRANLDEWFYLPTWERIIPPLLNQGLFSTQPRLWLLLADDGGLATHLSQLLHDLGQTVTLVTRGTTFQQQKHMITLDPAEHTHYEHLIRTLHNDDQWPNVIVHLWSLDATDSTALAYGYYSLLYLTQALTANTLVETAVRFLVITSNVIALTPQEELNPLKATLLGVCKVLPQEYPHLSSQLLDITDTQHPHLPRQILATAVTNTTQSWVHRGGHWWGQTYQPTSLPVADQLPIQVGGVYLLTGGLIEIGIEMARYLAQEWQAKLIFLEAPDFPITAQWSSWLATHHAHHPVSQQINHLQQLHEMGVEVLVIRAHLADEDMVQTAVAQAIAQLGRINGIIYNARVLGERSFRTIADTGPTESEWQFVPKIVGLTHLTQALAEQTIDFCLLNSSLSSILGGLGMVAYAAANSFVDTFARQQNHRHGGIWTTVNWDAWHNTQVAAVSTTWAKNALTADEGIETLIRILGTGNLEQVIVSTVDLKHRLTQGLQQVQPNLNQGNGRQTLHPRPDLLTIYVPPNNEREQTIATIWQQALGIDKVGVLDNFFELGGDSLLAIKTVASLKKALQMDIPVVSLYEELTIRSLAQLLSNLEQETKAAEQISVAQSEKRNARMSRRRQMQEEQRARRKKRKKTTRS